MRAGINFDQSLHLHSYFTNMSSVGTVESEPLLLFYAISPNKKKKCVLGNRSENFR